MISFLILCVIQLNVFLDWFLRSDFPYFRVDLINRDVIVFDFYQLILNFFIIIIFSLE